MQVSNVTQLGEKNCRQKLVFLQRKILAAKTGFGPIRQKHASKSVGGLWCGVCV
jgi:hypothetical protein